MLKQPLHTGEVLQELYLTPLDMGAIALARHLGLPRTRIERILKGTTGVTLDTALRLAKFFGTTPQYWMNLQINYEMANATTDVSGIKPLIPA